jgi:ubiquinone/menaquinone biosynthesis C-methylase UbiE
MDEKGHAFKGVFGGAGYDRWAKLFGMGFSFYRQAVGEVELPRSARVLDLGCGTGSLSIALAEKLHAGSEVHGIDISDDQLHYARTKARSRECVFRFYNSSMDELSFPDDHFDLVISSMALHETPPGVRRGAIREIERVLKKEGLFVLVDWSKPRFGLQAIVWLPFLFFGSWKDNWNNTYRALCSERNLLLEEDNYLNSLV